MSEVVTIKKNENVILDSFVTNFLNPKYIFLPIDKGFKLNVIDNAYVYKNDIVMLDRDGHNVRSSISGRVLGVKNMDYISGKKPSLVIENDFKENIRVKKSTKRYIKDYDKKRFIETIEDVSPHYKDKYILDKLAKDKEVLLVNGVELENYFGNKYFLLDYYAEEILSTIDLLGEIFKFKNIVFAIKNTETTIAYKYLNLIGTYPNINLNLINGTYPNGLDEIIIKKLNLSNVTVLSIEEIITLYHILKKQTPKTEKYITITGEAVKPMQVINVKKGSLLSEVFINNFNFTEKNVDVYLNGLISGEKVSTLKYVVDDDLEGIIVSKKENIEIKECINCGLCSKSCPRGLNPKYVYDHDGKVNHEYKESCIGCNLCSYVCPSHINLCKYMRGE